MPSLDPIVSKLVRPDLVALGAYSAHKAAESLAGIPPSKVVKLDANENPYGCSPDVQKALAGFSAWHSYPDANQVTLRRALEKYTGIDAGSIVASNGSGEMLEYILRLVLVPGGEVINCPPTFDLYRVRTLIAGGKLVTVQRKPDFSVDVRAIKAAITPQTRLIILANPNSPTGNLTPRKDIEELAEMGVGLLVDEAYSEFCGETVAPLVAKYKNLMVLRSCSKWAGLAGLRIGYGIFAPEIAAYVMKVKMPYPVNLAAQVAVQATVDDLPGVMDNVRAIIAERERLFRELQKLGWLKPFPSQANFILCSLLKGKAEDVQRGLEAQGILVRYFDQPLVANCLRISVGKPEHTDILLKALREIKV